MERTSIESQAYVSGFRRCFQQIQIGNFFYRPGRDLNSERRHLWAFIIGLIGGIITKLYALALKGLLHVVWGEIPSYLRHHKVFGTYFPEWNYLWLAPLFFSVLTGLGLKFLHSPGSIPATIDRVHKDGWVSLSHFFPMTIISLCSIVGGSSAGPEAVVIVLMAAVAGKIGRGLNQTSSSIRILALCGMSSGLSAFFELPLAGALFVLELPHRMGLQYYEALTPCIVSSLVSVVMVATSGHAFDGKFTFPVLKEIGITTYLFAAALGLLGALIAGLYVLLMRVLKEVKHLLKLDDKPLLTAVIGGLAIGLFGVLYPATLFWGEEQMQTCLDVESWDGNIPSNLKTPLPYVGHIRGLVPLDVYETGNYSGFDTLQIMFAKMITIIISVVAGFPGGVIYPLFYVGCWAGQGFYKLTNIFSPAVHVACLMASVEVVITRTPWATNLIILLIHTTFAQGDNHAVAVFPLVTVACYVSLFVTRRMHVYPGIQHSRTDIVKRRPSLPTQENYNIRMSISSIARELLGHEPEQQSVRTDEPDVSGRGQEINATPLTTRITTHNREEL